MKVAPLQSSFEGGEISPLFYARVDNDRYNKCAKDITNFTPTLQGPVVRRNGSLYCNTVKTSANSTRLVKFVFSATDAYVLEFGNLYIRFYKSYAQVQSGGSAYEVTTTYVTADLFQLKFTQSNDVLYITHPTYPPRKLSRFSATSWSIVDLALTKGPFLPFDPRGYTIQPNAATGSATVSSGPQLAISNAVNNGSGLIRITCATHTFVTGNLIGIDGVVGAVAANGSWTVTVINSTTLDLQGSTFGAAYVSGGTVYPGIFYSTDVGRLISAKEGTVVGLGTITAFTHAGKVVVQVTNTFTDTSTKDIWRLGAYSGTTGYPSCSTFHEGRLFLAGAPGASQQIDGSTVEDYENFETINTSSVQTASSAFSFTLLSTDVNTVIWLAGIEKGLLVGTVGNEWIVKGQSDSALSATNIGAKKATSYGSANIQPVPVDKAIMMAQRSTRKLREVAYKMEFDGYSSSDMTVLAEHITGTGIVEMAFQKEPHPVLLAVRKDGTLLGMTYNRDAEALRVGWHKHVLGGYGSSALDNADVESMTVIPSPDGLKDDIWLIVKRYVNGATVRHIEYISGFFESTNTQSEAYFVDCGITYNVPKTITGATKANPVVVTCNSHGFSNGDQIRISDVYGMTEIVGDTYTIANVTTNTFELSGIDGTSFGTYISGGYARKLVSTVSGLSHLEGQTVSILADGAVMPNAVVTGGSVSLAFNAAIVSVGLPYNSDIQLLRQEAGSQNGTALGKTRRIHRVGLYLYRSLGLKIGPSFDEMDTITFRTSSDPMTRAPSLFTGIISENVNFGYDFENEICLRQSQPLPCTILSVMPQLETQDRG